MATIELTLKNECNGRCHGDIDISLDGGAARTLKQIDLVELMTSLTQDDVDSFVKVLVKIGLRTRTPAQIRTALLNGFTVTI